jgi:hypothetical protein
MQNFLRLLARVLGLDVLILSIVVGGTWILGRRTYLDLSNAMFIVGSVIIIAGGYALLAQWSLTRRFGFLQGESSTEERIPDRTKRSMDGLEKGFQQAVQWLLVGASTIALAVVIGSWLV